MVHPGTFCCRVRLVMADRLTKYIELLRLLKKATPEQRNLLIEIANPEFIKTLCECCYNANRGNIPFKPDAKKKLKKYAPAIRKIASKKDKYKSIKKKRQLLIQEGGFLPALLTPIIGLAGGLIGELVARQL